MDTESKVEGTSTRVMTAAESNGIRLAVIGNVDSGKSTLVGVLCRNIVDDGRGKARSYVFHHKHELETGRSSAVTVEIMGFSGDKPLPVDVKASRSKLFSNVHEHADRAITFVDLCGHEKYLKTTIFGLTAMLPDYALIIVGANMGVSKMTKEHIGIAAALGLPLCIVVTKIDLAPPEVYKHTMETVTKVLKQARKLPYLIKTDDNVVTAAKTILTDRITPVVCVSSVSGEGLDLLRGLIRILPPRVSSRAARGEAFTLSVPVGGGLEMGKFTSGGASVSASGDTSASSSGAAPGVHGVSVGGEGTGAATSRGEGGDGPATGALSSTIAAHSLDTVAGAGAGSVVTSSSTGTSRPMDESTPGETTIDSVFNVPGVGIVVAGTVMSGCIKVGSTMLLGPDRMGEFQPVVIRSIHVQYTSVDIAYPGGSAAFAVRPKGKLRAGAVSKKAWIRKGMCLVDPALAPTSYWEFEAEILVLHHQTTLSVGYAPIMHCGVVTQAAKVTAMSTMSGEPMMALRTGDRAVITCRFSYRPEYIHKGDMLLFREGRAKGVGRVRAVTCPNHTLISE